MPFKYGVGYVTYLNLIVRIMRPRDVVLDFITRGLLGYTAA